MKGTDRRHMLLIVDPQIDFITGSLPVPGAAEAMDSLAGYIQEADSRYAVKVITADRHPYNHCSFSRNGGEWPDHCIHDTVGAAIWPTVFDATYSTAGQTAVVHKGEMAGQEEYSIFANPAASAAIRRMVVEHGITDIDVCGLAGDICVLSTLRDGLKELCECRFKVLLPYSPSIDGGVKLAEFINENHPD